MTTSTVSPTESDANAVASHSAARWCQAHSYVLTFLTVVASLAMLGIAPIALLALTLVAAAGALFAALRPPRSPVPGPRPSDRQLSAR
ncbi:hypothetical protein IU474_28180 [Nocardia otitidiscaviarum]|uniref:hypothetical protein n=1 Tax=Nocardia otitidiscaviarum TaxID=1823 RepID=UPI0018947454|nr:hypothetical protein [Nocardia otitidiscaviarum]MBF6240932.1 hypothetical protein [Nocardia otitidiscaviarum]